MHCDSAVLTLSGTVYILQRTFFGEFQQTCVIQAHNEELEIMALNNIASILATACYEEDQVKLWDVKQGLNQ